MRTADFDYHLPADRIAQTPVEPRDAARLLVLDRGSGSLTHTVFREIARYLSPGDALVLNRTRVIPARLHARKVPTGGRVEILLLERIAPRRWEALVGGRRVREGTRLQVEGGPEAEVVAALAGARRVVAFSEPVAPLLDEIGQAPLPPYIHEKLEDRERYQTVYARTPGSAAAPTAGLHFTAELLDRIQSEGVELAEVTLHIGLDTFAPVTVEDPETHPIHSEWFEVPGEAARAVRRARERGGRVVAVGTTSVRALESAASPSKPGGIAAAAGRTNLFILPGYDFEVVDALVTNFHLPRSTLLMLVSAFAGRERVLGVYETARDAGYRFYSFGDAMLIL